MCIRDRLMYNYSNEKALRFARENGINETNILKLISIYEQDDDELISSHTLSEKLGITMRSASRILAKLYELDLIQFEEQGRDAATPRQGRPSHYYRFRPQAFRDALL